MKIEMQKKFLHLMESGMAPALGCTDPVGIALCAAVARKGIKGEILKVEATFSLNLLKNVAAVNIPKTENLCGAKIATALGITGGNADKGLEVLEDVTAEHIRQARELEESGKITVKVSDDPDKLHMNVKITADEGTGEATIRGSYTNIVSIKINGCEQMELKEIDASAAALDEDTFDKLSLDSIIDFIETVPIDQLDRVKQAIEMNKNLAMAGLKGYNGCEVAGMLKEKMPADGKASLLETTALWTAAGVDARMSGCPLPAMSNLGSGNQGIVCTLPVYGASLALGTDEETVIRAAALSCLISAYIKHKIGVMTSTCGECIAAIGAGCAITYMRGGRKAELVAVLKNMAGNIAGMICDGAKQSCTLKMATCVYAAVLASDLAMRGFSLKKTNGIVGGDEEDTIDNFVKVSTEGLANMDNVIMSIIMNK